MKSTDQPTKPFNLAFARDLVLITIGSLLLAVGYSLFLAPVNIVPGGVYGLSIVINHITKGLFETYPNGLEIGTIALFFNVPLFLLALGSLGRMTAVKTVITFVLTAVFTNMVSDLSGGKAIVEGDPLLCAFYGGAILGFSVYLIFMAYATCAGTDTLARVLAARTNIKVSTLIIIVDSVVVFLGLIAFGDWRVPLYSWITIFVYGKVVDILQPSNPFKSIFIISNRTQELRDLLVLELGVRGTFLHGRGMYQGLEREVIFLILERRQVQQIKDRVLELDPEAFITTADASNDSRPKLV